MNYIPRGLERKFKQMNAFFKVVLVTGGKSVCCTHRGAGELCDIGCCCGKNIDFWDILWYNYIAEGAR